MPKFQKNVRANYLKLSNGSQDSEGGWHEGQWELQDRVWCCLSGKDHGTYYDIHAEWPEPSLIATFTRPLWPVEVGDRMMIRGGLYEIVSIHDLTVTVGRDVKVTLKKCHLA